jgi:hypothetical protein
VKAPSPAPSNKSIKSAPPSGAPEVPTGCS